jgi:isopentenyl phosphate kinase
MFIKASEFPEILMERLLLKIGGCLITDKSADTPTLNKQNINRICDEISTVFNSKEMQIILLHGAGSYGHPLAKATGLDTGIKQDSQLRAFALTQSLQNQLNVFICNSLIARDVPAIPVQASASAVMKKRTMIHMDTNAVKGFLDLGLVPVLYGVPAYDQSQGSSILSADQILSYLARKLTIKRIVFATDVDGIFSSDPRKNNDAKLSKNINNKNINKIIKDVTESTHIDTTQGMLGKVKELMKIKDIECNIVNGNTEGNIKRSLLGEKGIGTRISF